MYKFSIADSVEERILDLQEKKRALTNAALGGAKISACYLLTDSNRLMHTELKFLFSGDY